MGLSIVCISDTHNQLRYIKVPDGDVLVHAGDFSMQGRAAEIQEFNDQLGRLPHKHKIVIAGNHDIGFETHPEDAKALLTNATYLEDSGVEIEGVKFWGSPWQPQFYDWAFNLERGEDLREKWQKIPEDIDVLITHGPPRFILDMAYRQGPLPDESVGCDDLRDEVLNRIKPRYHVFGHIHESRGHIKIGDTEFINASILDGKYRIKNKPYIINI